MKVKLLLAFVVFFLSASVNATTYYISPTGNDATGNGSLGNPWKTLGKATSTVTTSGDIIHVVAGNYTQNSTCTLAVGVSIEGEGAQTTKIVSGVTGGFQRLIDMNSGTEGTNGNQHISGLWLDGNNLTTYWCIYQIGRSNVSINNCKITDFSSSGIIFSGRTDNTNNAPTIYSTGNSIYNDTILNCSKFQGGNGQGCVEFGGQDGFEFYNNYVRQDQRPDFQNGWPLKFYLDGHSKNCNIYNNKLLKKKFVASAGGNGDWDFCFEYWYSEGNMNFYNNYCEGGLDLAYNNGTLNGYSWRVSNNTITVPGDTISQYHTHGIILERDCKGMRIDSNIIRNMETGIQIYIEDFTGGITYNYLNDIYIRKNIVTNVGRSDGTHGSAFDITTNHVHSPFNLKGFFMYNNIFASNTGAYPAYQGVSLGFSDSPDTVYNVNIKNNVIRDFSGYSVIADNAASYWDTLSFTNNDLYNNGNNNFVFTHGAPLHYTNANNISLAPNYNATTYIPNTGSPLIDAGVNVGLGYTGLAPDIGAKEYASGGNASPSANAGPDQIITLPTSTITLTGSGTDPDGTIVSYTWTKVSGPAAGTISFPLVATTAVTGLVQGVYLFELQVTDNGGAIAKDTMRLTVNPVAVNIPPTANAGADQIITLPVSTVTLAGSGTDPDGTIATYAWTKISGPAAGTITNAAAASTTVTGLTAGTYKFELKVTDNGGATDTDTMQVTVNPAANIPPTANAGADQIITLPVSTVTLAGSGTDPDGTITAYAWTKISGPAAGIITNAAAASTTVTGLVQGVYKFELKVTDNSGAIGRDTMQVTVNPAAVNIPPTANAGADQVITLPVSTVTLAGSGTDPDGTITAYAWTKISGPAAGTITNAAAASTTVTGLVQGVYRFELKVTDNNGATGTDTMQVTVNPAVNIPPTANAGADQIITLPVSTVTLAGSGTDPDGTITAYAWTKISGPAAGTITNAAAASTTVTGLTAGIYKFELKVTDNSGATDTDTMQVTVNPAPNLPPTANAGADQVITLPINSVTLSGSGADADGTITAYAWTKISGPAAGTITNAAAASTTVTGLTAGIYKFELKVTDNSGATAKDTMQVTVNIAPVANAGPDQSITLPVNSVNLTGSASTDADGTITAYLWTKVAGPAGAGTITNATASSTSVTGLVAGIYKFELKVTDNNGATDTDTMQVIVFAPNIPPVANAGLDQSITLPTNTANLLGSGSDVDGTIVAYKWTKISGPAAGTITNAAIASTSVTGLVAGVYIFELKVTDNNGASATDNMQVTVNPDNIPPVANAGPDQTVILPTANNVTLSGSGTDVDGTIVAYKWRQISGPADKLLSPATAISVLDNLIAGTYKYELTVTDNKGATGKDTMVVNASNAIPPSQNSAKLYPNPVVDFTTLNLASTTMNATSLLTVTDMLGKIVYQKKLTATGYNLTEKINMSNLARGTYFVTVYFDAQNKQTFKALKL